MTHYFVSFSGNVMFYFFIKSELVDEKVKARGVAEQANRSFSGLETE